jgi:hypothetical protein
LHACGPSQGQTAEELHRHRPAFRERSVGRIYSRFQETERVSDKPKQVARELQVMLNAVGCICQDRVIPQRLVFNIESEIILQKSCVHRICNVTNFHRTRYILYKNCIQMIQIAEINFMNGLSQKQPQRTMSYLAMMCVPTQMYT